MSKSAKKRPAASRSEPVSAAKAFATTGNSKAKKLTVKVSVLPTAAGKKSEHEAARDPKTEKPNPNRGSKQFRVLAMLRSPAGATITAMMQATGWQQHSVRGFLAGVVRRRLKLALTSNKADGHRVYRIASSERGKSIPRQSKRTAA